MFYNAKALNYFIISLPDTTELNNNLRGFYVSCYADEVIKD